jgi:hypothetical protein
MKLRVIFLDISSHFQVTPLSSALIVMMTKVLMLVQHMFSLTPGQSGRNKQN